MSAQPGLPVDKSVGIVGLTRLSESHATRWIPRQTASGASRINGGHDHDARLLRDARLPHDAQLPRARDVRLPRDETLRPDA